MGTQCAQTCQTPWMTSLGHPDSENEVIFDYFTRRATKSLYIRRETESLYTIIEACEEDHDWSSHALGRGDLQPLHIISNKNERI